MKSILLICHIFVCFSSTGIAQEIQRPITEHRPVTETLTSIKRYAFYTDPKLLAEYAANDPKIFVMFDDSGFARLRISEFKVRELGGPGDNIEGVTLFNPGYRESDLAETSAPLKRSDKVSGFRISFSDGHKAELAAAVQAMQSRACKFSVTYLPTLNEKYSAFWNEVVTTDLKCK